MEKWDTETYNNFEWWQKIIFWLFIPFLFNLLFWLYIFSLYIHNTKLSKKERREIYVRGIFDFNIVVYSVIVIVVIFLI